MVTSTVIGGPHSGASFVPLATAKERVAQVRQEFVEAAKQRKKEHADQMRALARQKQDERVAARRAARRQYFDEVDSAYTELASLRRSEREQFVHRLGKRSRTAHL